MNEQWAVKNEEWVFEVVDERRLFVYSLNESWKKSIYYAYSPFTGICHRDYVDRWHDLSDKDKSRYRLRHIPTGKIIPGELL